MSDEQRGFDSFKEYQDMQKAFHALDREFGILKAAQLRLESDQRRLEEAVVNFNNKMDSIVEKIVSGVKQAISAEIGVHEKMCPGMKKPDDSKKSPQESSKDIVLPEWFVRLFFSLIASGIGAFFTYLKMS